MRAIPSAIFRPCIGSVCGRTTSIGTSARRAGRSTGSTIFIYNQSPFNAKKTLDVLARCGVTTLCAPPTVWRVLILEDLKSWRVRLREVVGAGEPLNPEVIEQVQAAWGLTLRDGYGQTPPAREEPASSGRRISPS